MIGDQRLFPLWKILSRQSNSRHPTNSGAYLVHWVACVVAIIAIATPHYNSHVFSIGTSIFGYGYTLIITIIAVALPWGAVQMQHFHRYRWWIIAALLVIVNLSVLIVNAIPIARSDSDPGKTWIRPIIAFAAMGMGILWGLFLCLLDTPGTAFTTLVQNVLGVRMVITPGDNLGLTRTVDYFQVRYHDQVIVRAGSLTEAVTGRYKRTCDTHPRVSRARVGIPLPGRAVARRARP